MTGPRRPRRRSPLLVATLALALAGCGGEDLTDEVAAEVTEAPVTTATAVETTAEPRLRDADVLDRDTLIAQMTEGTTGDPEWIEIFAALRVESWIASRYPESADATEIYNSPWAQDIAIPNLERLVADGIYLDQPVPTLLSVTLVREDPGSVQLEVVIEGDDIDLRSLTDDHVLRTQEGGQARGLFSLSQDGDDRWRIDSVSELLVVDPALTEETTP